MPNRPNVAAPHQLRQRRIAAMIGTRELRGRENESASGPPLEEVPGTAAHFRDSVNRKER